MRRRFRLLEFANDELNFANGPQEGSMVVGVDYLINEGIHFRKSDVVAVSLSLKFGEHVHHFHGDLGEMVSTWLDAPGNLQLLARRIESAEQRDPTPKGHAA